MSGLLRKDLLLLKASWKTYVFLILFYAILSFLGNSAFFPCIMALILLMLPLTSFSLDELARWDKFAAALPGGRRAVVKAKYQFLFLILAGAFVLSCAVNLLAAFLGRNGSGTYPELTATALTCEAVGLLANCLLYPLLFKYGAQKSRLYLALGAGVIFAVFGVGAAILSRSGSTPLDLLTGASPFAVAAGAVVLLAAAVVISYRVSRRIYDNKEF